MCRSPLLLLALSPALSQPTNFCAISATPTTTWFTGTASSVSLTTGAYVNGATCSHYINNPYGQTLTLTFTQFLTENSYDLLYLSAGLTAPWSYTNPSPLFAIGALSGSPVVPFSVVTSEREVGVFFKSDTSSTFAGVSLTVSASADGVVPPASAELTAALLDVDMCARSGQGADLGAASWAYLSTSSASLGGNEFNTDGQRCEFSLRNAARALLRVEFLSFDLWPGDNFAVYAPGPPAATLLAPRGGTTTLPDAFTTSAPLINFSFASDAAGFSRGVAVRVGPPGAKPPPPPAPRLAPPRGASDGAVAGVVVGVFALAACAGAAVWVAARRTWVRQAAQTAAPPFSALPPAHALSGGVLPRAS